MKALILVDIQNDLLPGGAIHVPYGDHVIAVANKLLEARSYLFDVVVATQDWHPPEHVSFTSNNPGKKEGEVVKLTNGEQKMYPIHCVQNTNGAALAEQLTVAKIDFLVKKGTHKEIDNYSAFFDKDQKQSTGLSDYLKSKNVDEIFVMGLATDYGVRYTALDGIKLGFKTNLIEDGCRGININPGDSTQAFFEMSKHGVKVVSIVELLKKVK